MTDPSSTKASSSGRRRRSDSDAEREIHYEKKRKLELKAAEDRRIERQQELEVELSYRKEDIAERNAEWADDCEWYASYHGSLKRTLQRELGNDAEQYFEKLYRDLVQWNLANRPSVSPLTHPRTVFNSLVTISETIHFRIINTVGYTHLLEKYSSFTTLAKELSACVASLDLALDQEDRITKETFWTQDLQSLETQYKRRSLRFFGPGLSLRYEEAGL
ncbi:hypothetical protein AAF712_014373 [Marasmius tenuissimus]|uniref:Uncharacterized protein n=1 Tax=Marasmius tenuissimus TaxID=585030 RepID=A0ABR2ZC55_9AGAR